MVDVIFLPGILAPAAVRYAPLLAHLDGVRAVVQDLAVYAGDQPPADYSIDHEVAAIARAADTAGLDRFHLYGHSGGGACALAFAAAHPDRVRSLALDEPAMDFTDEGHAHPYARELAAAMQLPEPQATATFLALQLAPGVPLPPRPDGPPPPWMAKRPAGVRALVAAAPRHRIDLARYRAVRAPVLFTYGSLSHPYWHTVMLPRLAPLFGDFHAVRFEGVHHLHTSHQAEPARTAALLRDFWTYAGR